MTKSIQELLFDKEAVRWESRYDTVFFRDRLVTLDLWLRKAIQAVSREKPVASLDVGCGTFPASRTYSTHGIKATGIDISTEMIKHACGLGRVARHYDGERIPCNDQSFDLISMVNVLEFVEMPEKLFREIKRVSNPDAQIIFTIVNQNNLLNRVIRLKNSGPLHGPEWVSSYTVKSISRLLVDLGFSTPVVFRYSLPNGFEICPTWFTRIFLPLLGSFIFRNRIFSGSIYLEAKVFKHLDV